MTFISGILIFLAMNGAAGVAAIIGARRIAGARRADFALAAGVLFFAQVVIACAVAGFTGNINSNVFLLICLGAALAVILLTGFFGAGDAAGLRLPGVPLKPLPVGFFLPSRRSPSHA